MEQSLISCLWVLSGADSQQPAVPGLQLLLI